MRKTAVILTLLATAAGVLPAYGAHTGLVLSDMQGGRVYVDSLLATGPVVLNFWATWCRPCRTEMPQLERIQKELAPKGIHFAAVSLDAKSQMSRLEKYLEQNKVTLPIYRDPEGTLARRFKVAAIPTTIVLDKDGEIHLRTKGYRPGDEVLLKKKLQAMVEGSHEESSSPPEG